MQLSAVLLGAGAAALWVASAAPAATTFFSIAYHVVGCALLLAAIVASGTVEAKRGQSFRVVHALIPLALGSAVYGLLHLGIREELLLPVLMGAVIVGGISLPGDAFAPFLAAAAVLLGHAAASSWQPPPALALVVVGASAVLLSAGAARVQTRSGSRMSAPHERPAAPPPPPRRTAPVPAASAATTKQGPKPEANDVAAAVLEAAGSFTTADEPAEIADRIAKGTTALLHAAGTVLLLWDEAVDTFRVGAVEGRDASVASDLRQVEVRPDSLPSLQTVSGSNVVQVDMAAIREPILQSLLKRWRADSLLAIRLQRADQMLGLLFTAQSDRRTFSERDISVLSGIAVHAASALAHANLIADLQAANQLKEEFMATMSHELRTPLNVILGYTELQLDGAFGDLPEDHVDTVSRIREQAVQLLELIQATLDMSRLERGLMTVDLRDISVADFMEHLQTQIPPSWRKPTVELNWRLPAGLPPIRTDPTKLQIVLRNLIHNALKFTHHGMVSITVGAQPAREQITFVVQDSGIGIKQEHLSEIFQMFRQISTPEAPVGGVGLGLYIVKRLAHVLGAEIEVSSTPGRGATFRVILPIGGPLAALK